MYAGQIAEAGPTETVLSDPKHPYTRLLLSAVADPREKPTPSSPRTRGEPPRVINPGEGCRFRWRCPFAIEKCADRHAAAAADRRGAGRLPRRGCRGGARVEPGLDQLVDPSASAVKLVIFDCDGVLID